MKTSQYLTNSFLQQISHASKTTSNIEVIVVPTFIPQPKEIDLKNAKFIWIYFVLITNFNDDAYQLLSREWSIIDANGHKDLVKGGGVVGLNPVLQKGISFEYNSHVELKTPFGMMFGKYSMVNLRTKELIDVEIPVFSLETNEKISNKN